MSWPGSGPWGSAKPIFLFCVAALSLLSILPPLSPAGLLGFGVTSRGEVWIEDQDVPWAGQFLSFFCNPVTDAGGREWGTEPSERGWVVRFDERGGNASVMSQRD